MGYAVRVDGDRVAAAAAELSDIVEDLTRAADLTATVLQGVASSTGGAALAAAARAAAADSRRGLHDLAGLGEALARATREAAEDYRAVERLNTGVWVVGGGTRWAP